MSAFNLLQYPQGAQRHKLRRWVLAGAVGAVLGGVLAVGLQQWQATRLQQLRAEHTRLKAWLDEYTRQTDAQSRERARQAQWQEQNAHLDKVQSEQSRWLDLHRALLSQSGAEGLRLTRLQVEADKLELHGRVGRASALARIQQALAAQSGLQFEWVSLGAETAPPSPGDTAHGVSFVWQSPWTVVTPPPAAKAARQARP